MSDLQLPNIGQKNFFFCLCSLNLIRKFAFVFLWEELLSPSTNVPMFISTMNSGSGSSYNGSIDYFAGLYETRPIKVFAVVLSVASTIIYIPLFSIIIYFVKFGSDQNQTILTKLYSSGSYCAIHWFVVVQIPESIRYIFGPLSTWFCYYHFILKNAVSIQLLLYSDVITVLRYLFIFKLKNPSGFSEGFWTLFLNIWITAFSYLTQFVLALQPGRQPLNFFICSGLDPSKVKMNTDVGEGKIWGKG